MLNIAAKTIEGRQISLSEYEGKVLLIVNLASECGYTPQYAGLENLWRQYGSQGLTVLGFPCNDFGGQEPGSDAEIEQFCTAKFDVTFPMFSKVNIKGDAPHPLYKFLQEGTGELSGAVRWNFAKFLVNRQGEVVARYDSRVAPDSEELRVAIEALL